MYYKIENKESEVYQKLHELRTKELQMDKENLGLLKQVVVIEFLSYLGHDQQTMSRTMQYTGFQFLHFRQISFKIWAEHKEEKSFYIPNLKTKEGRKMKNFLNNMQNSDFKDIFKILNLELSMDKFRVPYLEICGNKLVLMLGNEYQPKDENIIEITNKEFNEIRKAHFNQN